MCLLAAIEGVNWRGMDNNILTQIGFVVLVGLASKNAFAFILGVLPLVAATGAGAEMRQALGTAVFFGMLGVTFFGLVFTPVFYVTSRWIGGLIQASPEGHQRRQDTRPDSGHGSE